MADFAEKSNTASRNLRIVPTITFGFVEATIKQNCKSEGSKEGSKGYKYFSEKYITGFKEGTVGAVVPCRKGGYLVGLGRTVSHFDWETRNVTKLYEVENSGTHSRMNDAKCDPAGRFWTGTMGHIGAVYAGEIEKEKGALYCLDVDGKFTKRLDKIGISNGMAWTQDRKTMFYIDLIPRTVYRFNYDVATGKIDNQTVLIDFNNEENSASMGRPDGMTIDTDGNLWVACYDGASVICIDSKTEGNVGATVPCKKGGYLVGLGRTVSHFDWETRKVTKLYEVENGTHMNDAKCDPTGRFWTGTVGNLNSMYPVIDFEKEKGALFSLDVDGKFTKHLDNINMSNGMAWSQDKKTMFFIDSTPKTVYDFDYDVATGKIDNQMVLLDFNKMDNSASMGMPDGKTIDTDGNLWVACYGGASVICIDPNTGKVLRTVKFPAKRITSCCFGGKNLDELYVTSARDGASGEELKAYPESGSLFRVTGLGVKGYEANIYEGPISL